MKNIIRVTGAVNKVNPANPPDCLEEIKGLLAELSGRQSDIVVFPALSLCSPSCGNLFSNAALLEQCAGALEELQRTAAALPAYLLAGLAVEQSGRAVSAVAVLHGGRLVGLVPALDAPAPLAQPSSLPQEGLADGDPAEMPFLPPDAVFRCGELRFMVAACDPARLFAAAARAADGGCDLLILPAYAPAYAGLIDQVRRDARAASRTAGCAVLVVNGGIGDTSSPHVYCGFAGLYECGEEIAFRGAGYESFACTGDLDLDILRAGLREAAEPPGTGMPHRPGRAVFAAQAGAHTGLLREVNACPWIPRERPEDYLCELFDLQVRSLVCRMENVGITKLLLGVSGGLDSTAALLVSAAAMDVLGLPRENILAVTMPGFGTSDRTYYNALRLPEALGASCRDIPIRQAVQLHLEEIGHTGKLDITYENAQARERTQILLDLSNALSGLVVGTGDLSEAALGFCTFAGDQISNYNVNICIPKSVLRRLVDTLADRERIEGVADILRDILDTPISPELLPLSDSGDIRQRTEDILGPYALHDFFLYYFLRYRMRPSKIFRYACTAFEGELEPDFIRQKLALFLKKFCAGQFKRAAAPDCAGITRVNLCAHNHYIPSDLDPSALLAELDRIV